MSSLTIDFSHKPKVPSLYRILKILLRNPCLILMIGDWRSGKTDTSLLIGHLAKKWGFIDKIGSNVYTYDNPEVTYVDSMGAYRRWLFFDRLRKIFIFDEALTHLPRRRAMSKKSVDMVALIAELSKGHGRMVFCAQTTKIESTLSDSAFLRAVFWKFRTTKLGYSMRCQSSLFDTVTLHHLPKSPIPFDKDRLAEWSEIESVRYMDLSEEMMCATRYAEGSSMTTIAKDADLHQEQVKRNIRKVLKAFLKQEKIQVVNKPN